MSSSATSSGTAVTTSGDVLLSELADNIQAILSDTAAATWSQATVEAWVLQAIQDYTQHFTRRTSTTITTVLNDRDYDLPANFLAALSIEYPTSQDPPEYLLRNIYTHPDFWNQTDWYDIINHRDHTDVYEILISNKPSTGQTITVWYEAKHDYTLTSSEKITVPAHHHPILIAYVTWIASQNLQHAEQQSPTSNSSLLMAQFASNTDRLRRAHVEILAKAIRTEEGRSGIIGWTARHTEASLERIY